MKACASDECVQYDAGTKQAICVKKCGDGKLCTWSDIENYGTVEMSDGTMRDANAVELELAKKAFEVDQTVGPLSPKHPHALFNDGKKQCTELRVLDDQNMQIMKQLDADKDGYISDPELFTPSSFTSTAEDHVKHLDVQLDGRLGTYYVGHFDQNQLVSDPNKVDETGKACETKCIEMGCKCTAHQFVRNETCYVYKKVTRPATALSKVVTLVYGAQKPICELLDLNGKPLNTDNCYEFLTSYERASLEECTAQRAADKHNSALSDVSSHISPTDLLVKSAKCRLVMSEASLPPQCVSESSKSSESKSNGNGAVAHVVLAVLVSMLVLFVVVAVGLLVLKRKHSIKVPVLQRKYTPVLPVT